jgi:prefoldin subunit 5
MEDKLDKILQKLEILENKYKTLEQKIDHIQYSTQNMDEHIDFVESVYNVVKNPVSSLLKLYYRSYNNAQIEDFEHLNRKRKTIEK